MTQEELNKIADKHQLFLQGEHRDWEKMRADLSNQSLKGLSLDGFNFLGALCKGTDFSNARISLTNFSYAEMEGAIFTNTKLDRAVFRYAELQNTEWKNCEAYQTDFYGAKLYGANNVPFIPLACPEEGSFIGWKKVRDKKDYIVKLKIPEDAKRSSATERKCRCSFAKVLGILDLNGNFADIKEIINSRYEPSIAYRVGEIVVPSFYSENRWEENAGGIYFFLDKQDAINYKGR